MSCFLIDRLHSSAMADSGKDCDMLRAKREGLCEAALKRRFPEVPNLVAVLVVIKASKRCAPQSRVQHCASSTW